MANLTCNRVLSELARRIKFWIECNVEFICYRAHKDGMFMICNIHLKNGLVIEGRSVLLQYGSESFAKNSAREQALEKMIMIGQYVMSEALYKSAEAENFQKRIERK